MAQTIKKAISDFLEKEINSCYQEVTKNKDNIFKFNVNFFSEHNDFRQYDENKSLVVDQYRKYVKYIPCSVESIVGSRNLLPDVFLSSVNVPITMLVDVEDLGMVEEVLTYFSDITNGKLFDLEALYNNKVSIFSFSFSVDLPDMDNFATIQGRNAKNIGFMISGQLTSNLFYNNNIYYEISLDGGNTYEPINILSGGTARVNTLFSDQLIGEESVKSVEADSVWTKTLSFICKETQFYIDLISSIEDKNYINYKLDNMKLKTKIKTGFLEKDSYLEFVKDVIVSEIGYSGDYGKILGIALTLKEKLVDEEVPELR